ncbi:DUF3800 domain-containing protein [Pseudomonas sp. PDM03]|uniref:DUF3800 domain-containing protein n=1 Tax=Pseudomonas sp. PDM03 TaxID=2769266 RepID=UPI001786EEA1|nr:DUF3800 domain-containing protein [Pseudomonas sp. PDM03]MBD9586724.1 DUF3800 domain-containing protein [Pseudomonas sp. PDM03]
MRIFIDESGTFTFTPKHNAWSALAAVVILEDAMDAAESALQQFKVENGVSPTDELKLGKVGDEMSYFRLLNRLAQLNCTLYALATDAHLNTPETVGTHKGMSAQGLVEHIDKLVHQTLRDDVLNISNQVLRLSDQLYIQFICQIKLMHYVVSQAMNYYAQRNPETLGSFVWRVDQKDPVRKTEFEDVFENLSPPYLQSMSITDPLPRVEGFDYSHMARYDFSETEKPSYLNDHYNLDLDLRDVLDIKKLIREDIQFVDSKVDFGIQLADLLASGLRRCLRREFKDNLRAATFLGRLMVNRGRSQQPVLLLSLGEEKPLDKATEKLINMMTRQQRPMIRR